MPQRETDRVVKDKRPHWPRRGRPPLTDDERLKRGKPLGRWVPGGPGRPPLGKGQSKAAKPVFYFLSFISLQQQFVTIACRVCNVFP